ncbi:MAG: IPTL-CTERM sorting domain-containing protein [Thermodesulfobacteriota bacterium]
MAVNPVTGTLVAADEDNGAIMEFPTDVPTPILNPALINILAVRADFLALVTNVALEGGIAIDPQGNIYITNDGGAINDDDVIFKLMSAGDLSILCTEAQLTAVAGIGPNVTLKVGMAFSGKLFVGDDGDCNCILEIDPVTCDPQILITEAQIIALTGGTSADVEGGVCIDTNMNLFIGDDGGTNEPNIIKVPILNPNLASIFVSQAEIDNLYATISPGGNPRLEGSCGVKQVDTEVAIPTISEWGLIAMGAILGIIGFIVARRRMVKA